MANNEQTKNKGLACEAKPNTAIYFDDYTTGWRGALSAGNSNFRIHGTYDAPASGRRLRRMLERATKKASARHG